MYPSNQQKPIRITVEKFIKDSIRCMRVFKDTGNRIAMAKAKAYFRTVWKRRHRAYHVQVSDDAIQVR